MFKSIQMAPTDPILGLSDIYDSDKRINKINLGIGVYIDKLKKTPILISVKQAEKWLLNNEITKNYLSIEGMNTFNTLTQSLLFTDNTNHFIIPTNTITTVQTPGGTGALRIAAEFIVKNTKSRRIWITDPSWVNHRNIFTAAGLEVFTYFYYDQHTHSINFDKLIDSLKHTVPGDIILFHGCCHNPTGFDPTPDQWKILSDFSNKNELLPLFDIAYQGFSHGLIEDITGLHIFCKNNKELIICNSYSKNFGLYNERIGACTIINDNNNQSKNILSQLRSIIRANYSNPPAHGASIISRILQNDILKNLWKNELKDMRTHINHTRKLFASTLQTHNTTNKDFTFIEQQHGMFSFMGLHEEKVIRLRKQYGIYLVGSGRINLAGLSKDNVLPVCHAILELYK